MGSLRPYQEEALDFMGAKGRMIYGDAPGTGKTITTLRWLADLDGGDDARHLIVVPRAVLDHWQDFADEWYPELTVIRGDGTPAKRAKAREAARSLGGPTALLIHYEAMRGDISHHLGHWTSVTFDEAHRLKGRSTLTTKAARRLARRCDHLALVTGTPLMNRAEELWSMLNLLDPETYTSFWRFADEFFNLSQEPYNGYGQRLVTVVNGVREDRLEALRELVHPYLIQRSLDECLPNLPTAQEIPYPVRLTPSERKVYKQMEKHSWADLGDGKILQAENHLAKSTRLRQMASNFASIVQSDDAGSKAAAAIDLCEALVEEDEQVVVLTAYKATARAIADAVEGAVTYTGDESTAERAAAIDAFTSGRAPVLVGTIATLGEGVDGLQGARYLVMVDRDWTPARNEQAIARLRRSGQTRTVVVYHVYAEDTIDEQVHAALQRKEDVIEAILGR